MSVIVRWILAVLVVLVGLVAAAFTIFGGAFSTVACSKVPPDWIYYALILIGVLVLASAFASAILIVRRARAIAVAAPVVLGLLLMCGGLVAYVVLLGQYC